MSDRKRKPILFYSNLCKYSNDIHQTIIKCNALDNFLLVNITNGKFKIPKIIEKVPTILLEDFKTKLEDNEIEEYIKKIKDSKTNNIEPEPVFDDRGSISNNYSFWNEEENNTVLSNQYGLISDMINSKPLNVSDIKKESNDTLSDRMNNLQQERSNDLKELFKNNGPDHNLL
jgi:uncharacterized protein (DUF1786 family)